MVLCPCLLVGLLWAPPSQPASPIGAEPGGGLAFPLLPPAPLPLGRADKGPTVLGLLRGRGGCCCSLGRPLAPHLCSSPQVHGSCPGQKQSGRETFHRGFLKLPCPGIQPLSLSWAPPGLAARLALGWSVAAGAPASLKPTAPGVHSAPLSPGGFEPSAIPQLVPGMGGISQGKKAKAGDENRSRTPVPPCSTPRPGSRFELHHGPGLGLAARCPAGGCPWRLAHGQAGGAQALRGHRLQP